MLGSDFRARDNASAMFEGGFGHFLENCFTQFWDCFKQFWNCFGTVFGTLLVGHIAPAAEFGDCFKTVVGLSLTVFGAVLDSFRTVLDSFGTVLHSLGAVLNSFRTVSYQFWN